MLKEQIQIKDNELFDTVVQSFVDNKQGEMETLSKEIELMETYQEDEYDIY